MGEDNLEIILGIFCPGKGSPLLREVDINLVGGERKGEGKKKRGVHKRSGVVCNNDSRHVPRTDSHR